VSDIPAYVERAVNGDRGALARLLSIAEASGDSLLEIERNLSQYVGKAHIIGITGPPGAGKSTLINQLIPMIVEHAGAVAVLAVDPSSPFSHGAILGDRIRMQGGQLGTSVFIRSMASRGEAGGLARAASTSVRLFDACHWPVIIIETLGIGQVELDIMNLADTVLVVLNPGWGDSIQANKAGLTEAGDLFAINKADKAGVEQTRKDLLESLALLPAKKAPEIVDTVATENHGIDSLWSALNAFHNDLKAAGELDGRRAGKRRKVVEKLIADKLSEDLADVLRSAQGDQLLTDTSAGEIDLEESIEKLLALMRQK
jgi:LAO/AO transport system kinase